MSAADSGRQEEAPSRMAGSERTRVRDALRASVFAIAYGVVTVLVHLAYVALGFSENHSHPFSDVVATVVLVAGISYYIGIRRLV
jgi:hypothetical protein